MKKKKICDILVMVFILSLLIIMLIPTASAVQIVVNATYDGSVASGTDATWPAMRNGKGTSISILQNYTRSGQTNSGPLNVNGQYSENWRGLITWDTATIPDSATITSAVVSVYGRDKLSELGTVNFAIIDANPSSKSAYVMEDYNKTTFTRMATDIPYATFTDDVWQNFTLNAQGRANISKTGLTTFMFTHSADVDNSPLVWANDSMSAFEIRGLSYLSGSYTPFITINYGIAVTPVLTVSASPASVIAGTPTNVIFTVKNQSSGLAVNGASVILTGVATGSGTTSADGNATISVNAGSAGIITATASMGGYTSNTITVTALYPGSEPSGMMFRMFPNHTGDYSSVSGGLIPNSQLKWKYPTNGAIYSSPCVANDVVFIGSDDGNIYALNGSTGLLKWKYTLGNPGYLSVASSPAVVNGVVYVGSADKNLYALNESTGALKWKFLTGDVIRSSPTIVNGVVYFGSWDNHVYALNATTGAFKWAYLTSGDVLSSASVKNGILYIGSYDNNLYALDANTGAFKWKYTAGRIFSSPAVINGVVYVGSKDNNLHALDANTGALKWKYSTSGWTDASPTVEDDVVYIGSDDAFLYTLDAKTGALKWKYQTGSLIDSSAAISNGIVYFGSYDNNFYALDANTGGLKWKYQTGNIVYSSPAIVNGIAYFGSTDGNIYAIGDYPTAAFTGVPLTGTSPLSVQFTDKSTGSPTGWAWYFGDETYTATWTQMTASAEWSIRSGQTSVAMPDGSIVLMGGSNVDGYKNDVWRSTDKGATWAQMTANAEWLGRTGHTSVVMPDRSIVLMGGSRSYLLNDVWRSTDYGATWTQMTANAEWSARNLPSSVALPDGSIVLMGGADVEPCNNDVWRSTDYGATWTQMTASAEWSARGHFSSVAMPDGSIVLMGGYEPAMNDVWRSTNKGATWAQMTVSAEWLGRHRHSSVAMPDGSIVLMGGINPYNSPPTFNDVWRSTNNGATWTQMTANAEWSPRTSHNCVVLPDGSIVLIGGHNNDVWRLTLAGSSDENPPHTYTKPGIYNVALEAYNPEGYNITRKIGYITVTSPSTSINVTSPNGGETWKRGTPHTVTWDYTGNPGSTVKITVQKSGIEVGTINASTTIGSDGKGSYNWTISSTGSTGSDYKVSVQSISQPAVKDLSNNYFTIISATTILPVLTVTATPTSVKAGTQTNVSFTVKNQTSGLLVNGATVVLTGVATGNGITGVDGNATISVNPGSSGTITATVSKTGYTSGTTTVTAILQLAQNGKIAFASERDEMASSHIYLMNADGSEQTRLSFTSWAELDPAWSPDGMKIAFSSNGQILVMNHDQSDQKILGSGYGPVWSPDGMKIAFSSNGQVYVMNAADGSNPKVLVSGTDPAWSPDGIKIAFSSNGQVYVMNAADGSNLKVLVGGGNPAWSPNSTKIAFVYNDQIYVMNADGSGQIRITNNQGYYEYPAWSPDGTKIAFYHNDQIYVMNADGTGQTQLTVNSLNYRPSWAPLTDSITIKSPNGWEGWKQGTSQTIVWDYTGSPGTTVKIVLLKGDIEISTIASSAPIGSGGKGSYTWPISSSSPEGSDYKISIQSTSQPTVKDLSNNYFTITSATFNPTIAFASGRDGVSEIYVMNQDGTKQVRLTQYPLSGSNPKWSPDGKKIAFNSVGGGKGYSHIYMMNPDGTGQTLLTNDPRWYSSPRWSPYGTKIAVDGTDHDSFIFILNTDGTGETYLDPQWSNNIHSFKDPAWSPDGKKIAFTAGEIIMDYGVCNFEIYVMNANGTGRIRLSNTSDINHQGWVSGATWSPDGIKIAFSFERDGNSEIYVINADGSNQTSLAQGKSPSWSSDGSKIVFQKVLGNGLNDIYTMNADGSNPKILASGSNPIYTPDSTKIAFDSNGQVYVMNAEDGSNQTSLASGDSSSWRPVKTSITVTSPNGGETWQRGTPHAVTWDYTGSPGSTVKIVVLKGGIEVGTINASTSIGSGGKGSYTWTISPTGSTGSDYKVTVQSISQPTVKDLSNNYFSLTPAGTTTPSITVTAPNGGESWLRGTNHPVTWTSTGSVGSNVKIEALKAGVVAQTLSTSTPNNGTFGWIIPTGLATGSDYKIRIMSTSNSAYTDSSNSNFTITTGTTTPLITVTAPNGGESWLRGSNHPVTWTSTGSVGSNVKIEALKAGVVVQTLSTSTPNNGTFSWTIPTGLATGSDYKIRITSTSNSAYTDSSNSNFTIASSTTTPSITVTAPNGGESWVQGSNHPINWTTSGTVGTNVKIEALKAGLVAQTLSSSTPNNGTFSWTISTGLAIGADYKIRITSTSNSAYTDMSNSNFTITTGTTTPSITVTSPNGGESWKRGTSHAVTWDYTGSPGLTVKIVIMKAGIEVGTINASTSIGSGGKGSYSWTISSTGSTGSDYKVSIQSISQPTVKDLSNNYFTLTL